MTINLSLGPLTKIGSGLRTTVSRIGQSQDKRRLDSLLAEKKKAAQAHEAAGLAKGHKFYQRMYTDSMDAVNEYCKKYDLDHDSVLIYYPFLTSLESLALGTEGDLTNKKPLILTATALFAVVSGAAILAIGNGTYQKVLSLF